MLDASALLAMLQEEPIGEHVARLLLDSRHSTCMSTLNFSEVFDRLLRAGVPSEKAERLLDSFWIEFVDFDRVQARQTAR